MWKLVYGDLFRARDLFHWEHFGLRGIHSTPGTKSVIVLNGVVQLHMTVSRQIRRSGCCFAEEPVSSDMVLHFQYWKVTPGIGWYFYSHLNHISNTTLSLISC